MKFFQKWNPKSIKEFVSNHKSELLNGNLKIEQTINKTNPDFIAVLEYRKTEEGGRSTFAKSGYRPAIKFPFSKMQTSGAQKFIDKDFVWPGETVEAEIRILSVDFFKNQLSENLKFDFREGDRIIGTGKIIKITNPILDSASR